MQPETPWSAPETLAGALPAPVEPAIAVLAETPHLVWSCGGILYHSQRGASGWSSPLRLAGGSQPALAADTQAGRLHCLFTNEFAGNSEIYHITWDGAAWSLPHNVSRTTGASTNPALALGPNSTLHAAWADATPGYSTVYYGRSDGPLWSSAPVPSARGEMPSVAVTPGGDVYLAWQDRLSDTGRYDIFSSLLQGDGQPGAAWSIPENVSDSPQTHSLSPCLAVTPLGSAHMVWQESAGDIFEVRYSERLPGGWTSPQTISLTPQMDCRAPRLTAAAGNYLQVVWLQGKTLMHRVRPPDPDASWWQPDAVNGDWPATERAVFAISGRGSLHLAWTCAAAPALYSLYYGWRQPLFHHPVFLPIMRS